MLISVVLYGSRARGDNRATSDTDLLGIIDAGPIRTEIANRGVSLYHYPIELLLKKAKSGDLFVLHLVTEGIILHDTAKIFQNVKESFLLKKSYSNEILESSLIIMFFSVRPKLLANKNARKRLVWAIRTILIARSAEQKLPIFSSKSLSIFSGISSVKDVIDSRHKPGGDDLLKVATRVLNQFGTDKSIMDWPVDRPNQRVMMSEHGGIAADTLRFIGPLVQKKVIGFSSTFSNLGSYPD